MSNIVNIPVVGYKMDKLKLIIIVAIIVVILFFVINPGGFARKIIDAVGGLVKSAGEGIVTGIGDLTGSNQAYAIDDAFSARIDPYWKGNTWISWMTPSVYLGDPGSASIDNTTAENLYNNVKDAMGTTILNVNITSGDFSGIKQDFSNVIGNKTDISYVSYICQQKDGKSLGDMITEPGSGFYNNHVGSSGKENLQLVAEFLEWANSLPLN